MFFEVPSWYQFSGTTSLAAKCQKSHVFFDMLERNVNETLIFFEWIESRLLPVGGRGGVAWPHGVLHFGLGKLQY